MTKKYRTLDGNEAVAHIAYRVNDVICIYPITPSSAMGEHADDWASHGEKNIWGSVPKVVEMQSEGGAAGAVHGSLQAGANTTTFTASQGLLLMIPNMFKIAGELTPTVFHVAARSVAAQALSIFGDHSDVMATRMTGFGQFCSCSVQEAMDFALIAERVTFESRIPFIHFFDGFRTSHEVSKVEMVQDETIREMLNSDQVRANRKRALSPDHPFIRGSAQNPDVFFQGRETVNKYYQACPDILEKSMDRFCELTGRRYQLFEYHGDPQAELVVALMGSGCEAVHKTVDQLIRDGRKVGMIKVRLYRPFDTKRFIEALPASLKSMAILDRTKEPGSVGEPLYQDCTIALREGLEQGWGKLKTNPRVIGGRYGLSSKEFTPAMIKGIFDHLLQDKLINHFTVGINDDVTHLSLPYDEKYCLPVEKRVRAMFFGLGSDGTVGANKNTIKIIGENTDNFAQGYFVYDSKKAGAMTVSHLRFGPDPIRSSFQIIRASFVDCHQPVFLDKIEMLSKLEKGGTFLLNTPFGPDEIWDHLPIAVQKVLINQEASFHVIDADSVAKSSGMGKRINTIMQVCFFAISGVLPKEEAIDRIKDSIRKTYGKKGEAIVETNLKAVDATLDHLYAVKVPSEVTSKFDREPAVSPGAPDFVKDIIGQMIVGEGDRLPVSKMPVDGTFASGTSKWEKRNLATEVPAWEPDICIQCGKCTMICPHAVIRVKAYAPVYGEKAPKTFKSIPSKDKAWEGQNYTIQVSTEDCTGCQLCVEICPATDKSSGLRALNMVEKRPILADEKENWQYFTEIPETSRALINVGQVRSQQAQLPLFEFSGACSGCGETPYIKLATQLFGDRMVVANATGCSSIYGGNLPTTPWTTNAQGRGPAWSNSLFEDNAEFGMGMRLAIDKQAAYATECLGALRQEVGEELADKILSAAQTNESEIFQQRERVQELKQKLESLTQPVAKDLHELADCLVKRSIWIIGGDGWAYDIGFGGLDHVLASGENVNILVLDTEVYSNTGGQMSKATPKAAVAKFAAGGKQSVKKDLGMIAMSYKNVYVASVAMGAKDQQTLKAFNEAEAYPGVSIIIAYSHCIAHGMDMTKAIDHQKMAVDTGYWMLYRYNPTLRDQGKNPLILDCKKPKRPILDYLMMENRFRITQKARPEEAAKLFASFQEDTDAKWEHYSKLASL